MLQQCAEWLQATGHVSGDFNLVSIDSRTLTAGDLFIALKGPQFDGHRFVESAFQRGAAAALVERPVDGSGPCLQVSDTVQALNCLARHFRARFTGAMVAVTGSCGKTTTRHMISTALKQSSGAVLETEGNLNNHYGVPLMLTRLAQPYAYAVLECAASGPGEIAPLAQLVQPDVAVITNVHPVHLRGFEDLDTIAQTKGALFSALSSSGIAVMPVETPYQVLWREYAQQSQCLTFGLSATADVSVDQIQYTSDAVRGRFLTPQGQCEGEIPVLGEHHLCNALAALAAGVAVGISPEAVIQGLSGFKTVSGRMQVKQGYRSGLRVIDDTYNSNPVAFEGAVDVLCQQPGASIVVMGDMLDLGDNAPEYHRQVGAYMRQAGVEQLWTVGALSRHAAQAYGQHAQSFDHLEALLKHLPDTLASGCLTVLIKASRASGLERVVSVLCESGSVSS